MSLAPHFGITVVRGVASLGALFAFFWMLFGVPPLRSVLLLPLPFAVLMLLPWPRRTLVGRGVVVAVAYAFLVLVYFAPSERNDFVHTLYKVRPGMTDPEVRAVMHKYIEGTAWPAPYPEKPPDAGPPAGELEVPSSIVFRWSPTESDWGVVAFKDGRVTKVEFWPD